ncbi:MAG TPA: hypothetical protein VFI33_17185 [Puia sp.]|nr:hypothetical protein [Puia sp.]
MAEIKDNYAVKGIKGRVGTLAVYKIINGRTFMTKYPDRSKVVYTKEQIGFRKIFAEAAKFASDIINDPDKRSFYPRQGQKSIYHCALSDYMKAYKRMEAEDRL